jgi:class 3 adenylate cyclase
MAATREAIEFLLDLQGSLDALAEETGIEIMARAGVHTGPGIGGVTGSRRLAYDYWGDSVNLASRIESRAEPGGIAVSEATYLLVRNQYNFSEPVEIELKGIGKTKVFRLVTSEQDPSI